MASSANSGANTLALHTNSRRFGSDLVLTEIDVDGLAGQFLDSAYGSDQYANWPFDRRLQGFLQHRGLGRLADNGDVFSAICDSVMANLSCPRAHRGGGTVEVRARPTRRR